MPMPPAVEQEPIQNVNNPVNVAPEGAAQAPEGANDDDDLPALAYPSDDDSDSDDEESV